jgi:hypothetical protein
MCIFLDYSTITVKFFSLEVKAYCIPFQEYLKFCNLPSTNGTPSETTEIYNIAGF